MTLRREDAPRCSDTLLHGSSAALLARCGNIGGTPQSDHVLYAGPGVFHVAGEDFGERFAVAGFERDDHLLVLGDSGGPIVRAAVAEETNALQARLHDAVHGCEFRVPGKTNDLSMDSLVELVVLEAL